jgi:hypothetical protein
VTVGIKYLSGKTRKRAARVDWDDWEDAFIMRHFPTGRKTMAEIARALHRPYNNTKCHIAYMKAKKMFDGVEKDDSVWEPTVESKREFMKHIVEKYGLTKEQE